MVKHPEDQKTVIVREINAGAHETLFDYWFHTQTLKNACDELHTVWSGPPTDRTPSHCNQESDD